MKEYFSSLPLGVGTILSAFISWLFGMDGLTIALLTVLLVDYFLALTVIWSKGAKDKTSYVNSTIGRKGICRKIAILIVVFLGSVLDKTILIEAPYAYMAFAIPYIGNELLSITKHLTYYGLPIPQNIVDTASKFTGGGK